MSSKAGLVTLALIGLLATGCSAVVGGGVFVGLVTIGALAYSCDEPVGVDVWDRKTAHTICDAKIVAELEENGKPAGHQTTFSPCYRGYLGTGTWRVTASKPGYVPAVGSVVVEKQRHCSEPTFHSMELTLVPEGYGTAAPLVTTAPISTSPPVEAEPPPLQSAAPPPPATALPPAPEAAPPAPAPAAPPAGPAPSAPPATPAN
jgi:hypothetical protein